MRIKRSIPILALLCFFSHLASFAQNKLKEHLINFAATSDSLARKHPAEKLYLQFDKPNYAVDDTIWFKAYVLNATYLVPSVANSILYIDITSDSGKVVKQYRMAVAAGLSWGNISLDGKDFKPGNYTLHAYNNWLRNFGE